MATLNPTKTGDIPTIKSHDAGLYQTFVNSILTSFIAEPKYYGDNTDDIIEMAEEIAREDPLFLAQSAIYTRTVFNMRSISHVLIACLARIDKGSGITRKSIRRVVLRADDVTSIFAAYEKLYGKPFPNSLVRGCRDTIETLPAYALAKYQLSGHEWEMRDAIKLCHPDASGPARAGLYNRIIEGNEPMPRTWERDIVELGNTAEMWTELIESDNMPYMAMLRNLRNIIRSGVDTSLYVDTIADPARVKSSRQLPFRYFSAYRNLPVNTPTEVYDALETALELSVENMPYLEGRTLIAVDSSSSMNCSLSSRSELTCAEVAALLGVSIAKRCETAYLVEFSDETRTMPMSRDMPILGAVNTFHPHGGCTNLESVFDTAIRCKLDADRIVVLSDNEANMRTRSYWAGDPMRALAEYRKVHADHDVWVHSWDMLGYGKQYFAPSDKLNYIAGWSEKGIEFISLAEKGVNTLLDAIADIRL